MRFVVVSISFHMYNIVERTIVMIEWVLYCSADSMIFWTNRIGVGMRKKMQKICRKMKISEVCSRGSKSVAPLLRTPSKQSSLSLSLSLSFSQCSFLEPVHAFPFSHLMLFISSRANHHTNTLCSARREHGDLSRRQCRATRECSADHDQISDQV